MPTSFCLFNPSAHDSDSKGGATWRPGLPQQSSSQLAEKTGPEKPHLVTPSGKEIPSKAAFGKESERSAENSSV